MMIAAIYARKSTEQNGVADDQKSIARQVEHARRYAERKGWTVDEACVFVDDGISGAEFVKRPGFVRLLNALKPRPSFQVLVMSEESRLGREAIETAYAFKQIVTAGVRVFFYLEDRERTLNSPTDKIMLSLTAFADELEREKARQRTYDAMVRKARAGHVTGGRVFGYDNVEILAADGERSHVERRINTAEAAVVGRIFELCAAGKGLRSIAKRLNDEHVTSPRPQQGRPRAWVASTVREVLYRPLYRGQIVWNRTRKRTISGQVKQADRGSHEWITVAAPALRVVSDELWTAVHARLEVSRRLYLRSNSGKLWGRPTSGLESKYLLTGLARCAECGGTLTVRSRGNGTRRAFFYACSSFHHRGRAVCANSLEMRLADADESVLTELERHLLAPDILEEAMTRAIDASAAEQPDVDARRHELRRAVDQLQGELERLTAAVLAGGEATTLVQAMKDRERRRDALQRDLAALDRPRNAPTGADAIRALLHERLAEWRSLLRKHAPVARQMLRKLMTDRIVFTPQPETRSYRFSIPGDLSRFFNGLVCPPGMASPAGFEPAFWP